MSAFHVSAFHVGGDASARRNAGGGADEVVRGGVETGPLTWRAMWRDLVPHMWRDLVLAVGDLAPPGHACKGESADATVALLLPYYSPTVALLLPYYCFNIALL